MGDVVHSHLSSGHHAGRGSLLYDTCQQQTCRVSLSHSRCQRGPHTCPTMEPLTQAARPPRIMHPLTPRVIEASQKIRTDFIGGCPASWRSWFSTSRTAALVTLISSFASMPRAARGSGGTHAGAPACAFQGSC